MFEKLIEEKVENKIAEIIITTAKENAIAQTEVTFALKVDAKGKVLVIPYYNGKVHPVMSIGHFLK